MNAVWSASGGAARALAHWMTEGRPDDPLPSQPIDVALELASALLRVGIYAVFAGFVNRYDCGAALLTGVLTGDLIASAARWLWRWSSPARRRPS